ncbi:MULTISPECIES: S41 family peptidase [unclassified Myxococcus]|uniref:S41 family peptidase n=1 Tax=unclassified Myxococcus TaxID=2648731 RepID=UPI0020CC070E|nr:MULTISPECIES: S41 family peptidase [unclassified Myxococcus]
MTMPQPETTKPGTPPTPTLATWLLAAACAFHTACGDDPPPTEPPPPQALDWCPRITPGSSGMSSSALAMSNAHALVRFFSPGSHYREIDAALAGAMEGSTVDWNGVARAYAEALDSVCAHEATASADLPVVQVEQHDTVAVIRPGTGEPVLPEGTRAVAIDLRGLPDAPGLEEALTRAISVASSQPVPRVSARVRVNDGMTDEYSAQSLYSNTTDLLAAPDYPASGAVDLPVALLTGPTLPPAAARFVVDLRTARRAWLWGEPVATAVAESRWVPLAAQGLSIRTSRLEDSTGPLPDQLPADRALAGALADSLSELPTLGTPAALDRSAAVARTGMTQRQRPTGTTAQVAQTVGIARASLLITHGAVRRFFPYFHVVGDGIDARLEETLAAVDATPVSQLQTLQLLRRFGAVLQDGHVFVSASPSPFIGDLPALLEEVAGGDVVVRRSLVPELQAGDTLVRVGDRSTAEWYAEELSRTSAATHGYRHALATRRLLQLTGPLSLVMRAMDGTERTVQARPWTGANLGAALGYSPSRRASGWLGDVGAPTLYYITMSSDVTTDLGAALQHLDTASAAQGLIVDMRGYPGFSHYDFTRHLIQGPYVSPLFRVGRWTGPDAHEVRESQYAFTGSTTRAYTGPLVLLVGPRSVSAAENFSTMLVGANRVRVVGQRSAGTNGNITNLLLPGGFRFMYTGMEVLRPDRSTFHGVGIVPDEEIVPTTEDFATGRDAVLLKAIDVLQAHE